MYTSFDSNQSLEIEVIVNDKLLYVEEVAGMLRKTPSAFRYQIHKGNAPRSAKIGGRLMFRESDVLAWLDQQFEAASWPSSTPKNS